MANFNVPASPKMYKETMVNFKGVDFANNATQVEPYRSPNAQNIISDLAGKPVKRTGYETIATFGSRINGIFRLATEDIEKIIVMLEPNYLNGQKQMESLQQPAHRYMQI